MSLDDCVDEVVSILTGMDLSYTHTSDRYRVITRCINRALRLNALQQEWSYYASTISLGQVRKGDVDIGIPTNQRPRIMGDDALRLVDSTGAPKVWAYFLPRDALHKYAHRQGLWCAVVRQRIQLSRPINSYEDGLEAELPTMREPVMLRLPPTGEDVSDNFGHQLVDFAYPDLIIAGAALIYAESDPVMQPRVQTLEQSRKDLMFQIIERDTSNTDMPYLNEFVLPVENSLESRDDTYHLHPHS